MISLEAARAADALRRELSEYREVADDGDRLAVLCRRFLDLHRLQRTQDDAPWPLSPPYEDSTEGEVAARSRRRLV